MRIPLTTTLRWKKYHIMIYLLVFRCFSRLMLGFIAAGFDTIVVLNYVNSMAGISSKHLLRLQMAFMPTI